MLFEALVVLLVQAGNVVLTSDRPLEFRAKNASFSGQHAVLCFMGDVVDADHTPGGSFRNLVLNTGPVSIAIYAG